jgi:hypothetical protein
MDIDKLEDIAGRAGMYTDLMRMGAASLVYSPGCKGVTIEGLTRFAALVRAETLEEAAKECETPTPRPFHAPPVFMHCTFTPGPSPGLAERLRVMKTEATEPASSRDST